MIRLSIVDYLPEHNETCPMYSVRCDYVRDNWLPLLGPTSFLVLTSVAGQPGGISDRDTAAWAKTFGVKPDRLVEAFKRLQIFRLADTRTLTLGTYTHELVLPLNVPALKPHQLRRARPDLPLAVTR